MMKMQTDKNICSVWNDEDCIVDDDTSASSSVNIPHETTKFVNTLIDNKGHVLPEDVEKFVVPPQIEKVEYLAPLEEANKEDEDKSDSSIESVSDFEDDSFMLVNLQIKKLTKRRTLAFGTKLPFQSNKALWASCKDKPSKEIL